jgi:hypothetical protein
VVGSGGWGRGTPMRGSREGGRPPAWLPLLHGRSRAGRRAREREGDRGAEDGGSEGAEEWRRMERGRRDRGGESDWWAAGGYGRG